MNRPVAVTLALLVILAFGTVVRTAPPNETDEKNNPVVHVADAAAERKLLNEALTLVKEKDYLFAIARLGMLEQSRFLPMPITKMIPGLIAEMRQLEALSQLMASEKTEGNKLPSLITELLPKAVKLSYLQAEVLQSIETLMELPLAKPGQSPWSVPHANKLLGVVETEFGADAASRLRNELSAKLFLMGHSRSASELLEVETPSEHAREVLADLRAIILGEGALKNAQIARFVPTNGLEGLPGIEPLVPTHLLEKWQRPKPPADEDTTLVRLKKRARKELTMHCSAEADRLQAKVLVAANIMGAALAKFQDPAGK